MAPGGLRIPVARLGRGAPLLVPLALAGALLACGQRNVFVPPPPPEVTVATPVERPVVDSVEFSGTTRASARVDLRARVNGYLERIEFEDGQEVRAGDLLFVIDRAPFEAEVQAARANLLKARAALQLQEANLARARRLYREEVTAQQELDVREAEQASAAAEVAAAEAALVKAELNLGYAMIRAPISGRIGRHLVDVGNLVQAEQTLLATIECIDPIHAYFYLSERELLRFREMLRAKELPDPELHPPVLYLGLTTERDFPHQGHLDYRQLGLDPDTGTVERRGVFQNPDGALVPGLFVRIRAPIGEPAPRLLIDERAIGSDQRGDYVLVVNEDNTVEYRPVELGIAVGGMRVILSGVRPDERIVVNGLQRARPGEEVVPELAPSAPDRATAGAQPVPEPPPDAGSPAAAAAARGSG